MPPEDTPRDRWLRAAKLYESLGSYRLVAERMGVSKSRAQQLVAMGRRVEKYFRRKSIDALAEGLLRRLFADEAITQDRVDAVPWPQVVAAPGVTKSEVRAAIAYLQDQGIDVTSALLASHGAALREAAAALNKAIVRATEAGLQVDITVSERDHGAGGHPEVDATAAPRADS